MGGDAISPEEMNEIMEEQPTMHSEMEDAINPPKRRRGRPKKKMKQIAPTEPDEKDKPTIIDVKSEEPPKKDLNEGFDLDDAKETEEK